MLGSDRGPGRRRRGRGAQRAEDVIEWKLVTTWPKNFRVWGAAREFRPPTSNEMSGGRLRIRSTAPAKSCRLRGVRRGVPGRGEMGHGAAYYWTGKVPSAVFFTAVPFGLTAEEMPTAGCTTAVGWSCGARAYAPFNLVPLPGGNTGRADGRLVQPGNQLDRGSTGPENAHPRSWRRGVQPGRWGGGDHAGGELYTSLQTGVIDATEWVGPYNDLAMGLHEVAEYYYYYPGWQEPGPVLEFIVNKDAFESLPADLQAIVEGAARNINQDMLDEYTARNNRALTELVEVHGVKLRRCRRCDHRPEAGGAGGGGGAGGQRSHGCRGLCFVQRVLRRGEELPPHLRTGLYQCPGPSPGNRREALRLHEHQGHTLGFTDCP